MGRSASQAESLDGAVAAIARMFSPNPRPSTEDDIRNLLGRAFDGAPPVN